MPYPRHDIGIRWTIGDVSAPGFEALRLSIWGARRLFGSDATYVVCVNTLSPDEARRRTGKVPADVVWRASEGDLPQFLGAYLSAEMAEGVAWKLAPLRLFPSRYELSLDNDCILWAMPVAIAQWLESGDRNTCVLAADIKTCFGKFADLCGPEPGNTGIRGFSPGFDLAHVLERMLRDRPVRLESELDEQGLQVAALRRYARPLVVTTDEVTICSPFWPHQSHIGRCGAHFVGLNAHALPWTYYDRPATACVIEHWERHKPQLYEAVGLHYPAAVAE
ncbi:MAG TPA: hypothetical protein VF342_02740 [Alphaproteobacteria bacterium]